MGQPAYHDRASKPQLTALTGCYRWCWLDGFCWLLFPVVGTARTWVSFSTCAYPRRLISILIKFVSRMF